MRVSAARTRSSRRRSLRLLIQTKIRDRITQSIRRCFVMDQTSQPSHDGKLRSFFDLHSRPVEICSRMAATSADSLVMARSILRCDRPLPTLTSWPISRSSRSVCRCDRSSASSCSLMGLSIFMGPSLPLIGCVKRRGGAAACGEESVALGLLCLIWFQTNSSSETSSLPSLLARLLVQLNSKGYHAEVTRGALRCRCISVHSFNESLYVASLCFGAADALLTIPCIPFVAFPLQLLRGQPGTGHGLLHDAVHIALHCLLVKSI